MHARRRRYAWVCAIYGHQTCHCGYCKRCGRWADTVEAIREEISRMSDERRS